MQRDLVKVPEAVSLDRGPKGSGQPCQIQFLGTIKPYEPSFDEIGDVVVRNTENFGKSIVECPI